MGTWHGKAAYVGQSTTGSKHTLECDLSGDGYTYTIVGANGKRHATVWISLSQAIDLAQRQLAHDEPDEP